MDNKFFQFVEEYKDDILAFFEALKNFVQTVFGKIKGEDEEAAE